MKKSSLLLVFASLFPISSYAINIPIVDIPWSTKEPESGVRYESVGELRKYKIDLTQSSIYRNADVFFKNGKIAYVNIVSKYISDDYYMEKIVSVYKGEKEKLSRNYKLVSSHEYIYLGNRYGIESPLKCLNYLDCGKYNSYFEDTLGNTIRLEIKSLDGNKSYLELSLQNSTF